jgi:ferredoxin
MEPLEREGVGLNFNLATRKVSFPEGKLVRSFELIEAALDADVLVSIAKAKTHTFAIMTGAVKNLFGLVPGFDKPGFHARMKTSENFAEMLVDLVQLAKPPLSVVDAIVGMEGDGPTSGSPRRLGFLLGSTDPHALDVVLAHLMGIDPLRIPTIAAARARGLASGSFGDIELVGDVEALRPAPDFVPPRTVAGTGIGAAGFLASLLEPLLRRMFVLTPVPVRGRCVGCGACQDACPNVAIAIENGKARISRDQCIRCYCCHEACPHGAMKLKRSVLYRLFHKVAR